MLVLLNFQTRFRYAGRIGNGEFFFIRDRAFALNGELALPFSMFFMRILLSGPWFVPFIILCMQEISRSDISGITTKHLTKRRA